MPKVILLSKSLYKNTKQKILNDYVKNYLTNNENINLVINLNKYIAKLTQVVFKGIKLSVSIGKPSFYNKK